MKILFVCSCLEPGRDGVGDYTRRLATELTAQGHACALLALSDALITEPVSSDVPVQGETIPCLRLPPSSPWPERIARAQAFREKFAPDWVSFQIVLYGFNSRGLCFGLGHHLNLVAGPVPRHVMLHEIWIGEAVGSPFKNRLIGWLQRRILQGVITHLQPKVVHTHTPLYQHLLKRIGTRARLLPLFGNIPLATAIDPEWLAEKCPAAWGRLHATGRDAWWIFVLFGSIHPEWDGEDFWRRASEAARRAGKHCAFIAIGRPGGGDRILLRLHEHDGPEWITQSLGAQPEADVSQCLLAADFGVSPVPPEYLSKSGTAVAMIEHGLPVIATRGPYRYAHCPPEKLVVGLNGVTHDFHLEKLRRTAPESLLPKIARQFRDDLSAA